MDKIIEEKKVTSYLNEPLKFRIVPFAKGHSIEVVMNLNWSQVDQMNDKEGPIRQGIANCMTLIVEDLHSTVLRVNKEWITLQNKINVNGVKIHFLIQYKIISVKVGLLLIHESVIIVIRSWWLVDKRPRM